MKTILNIIEEIAVNPSRNAKETILQTHQDNETLKRCFELALNPQINFFIKLNEIPSSPHVGTISLDFALQECYEKLSKRVVTGTAARVFVQKLLSSLTYDDAIVLGRVINKDMRCGAQESTINKIWKGSIPSHKVMLAGGEVKHIKFPAIAQVKCDGARVHAIRTKDAIMLISRSGNVINISSLDDKLLNQMLDGETWDGELIILGEDRKISNGIINKAIRGTIGKEDEARITFVVWDIIDETGTIPYSSRLEALKNRIIEDDHIRFIETRSVNNYDDCMKYFDDCYNRGEEGIIVKNSDSKWEGKKSNQWVKVKAEHTADLVVKGWIAGEGKYKGQLGAIECETADGKVKVSVGSGFTDADRNTLINENIVDRIVEVVYNAKIKNDKDEWSLYLPRFSRFRDDEKSSADNFTDLKG